MRDESKESEPIFEGTFEVINGKLNFNCLTRNLSFKEVKSGLIKLRDEIQRQLDSEENCPYNQTQGERQGGEAEGMECEHDFVYKILHDHTAVDICTKCKLIKNQTPKE